MIPLGAFIITAGVLLALMIFHGFAPFGELTFAADDASIQYLDFFAYFRRLLDGSASPTFSFDKGLGGNVFAVLTYYLASPPNVLILAFEHCQLQSFYDLIVVLKLSLSSAMMAVYLTRRFERRLNLHLTLALSICFGLMQYNLEQAKNVMWLDGVWLLPLIMLGLDRLRRRNESTLFIAGSAAAIVCNWYSGLISVMFAGLFSMWEFVFDGGTFDWKKFCRFECKVFGAIILALGLSSSVFLPTLDALSNGRASIDWEALKLEYHGKPLALFANMRWGLISLKDQAALFTGDLVTVGVIAFFFRAERRARFGGVAILLFIALMFYWQPLFFLFSLLKDASSYWYRYAYLASFMLIFLAASGLSSLELSTRRARAVLILSMIGLIVNAGVVQERTAWNNVGAFRDYVTQQSEQVRRLKAFDASAYRVNQSRPGFYSDLKTVEIYLTANYNEGAAYGYHPLATYTSSPNNAQLRLLDRLGYRKNGDNMNVVNVPVLPTDSLLGVKYIFSDLPIEGLTPLDELGVFNAKRTYRNDFAMPLAFVCRDFDLDSIADEGNPFEYTNAVFDRLFGETIYRSIEYSATKIGDTEIAIELKKPPRGAIYGNIPTTREYDGRILIGARELYAFSRWLGVSAFYIPRGADETIEIRLKTVRSIEETITPQFYVVDEERLAAIAERARNRAARLEMFSDDRLVMSLEGRRGEMLFTSIPLDDGWKIELNGRQVEPQAIGDCLIGLTLDEGRNLIELRYELPGLKLGGAISLACLILLIAFRRFEWKN